MPYAYAIDPTLDSKLILDPKFIFDFILSEENKSVEVFSSRLTEGTVNTKWVKYRIVLICPNSINGDSTCSAPNFIKTKKLGAKLKKAALLKGLNRKPFDKPKSIVDNNIMANIALNIAITPNSLSGIDIKTA